MVHRRKLCLGRNLAGLSALTWLLASLATAASGHAVINALGTIGAGGDAYDDHAHAAVAPVALGALALVATLLLRSVLRSVSRAESIDPAIVLAKRFGTLALPGPAAAVMCGGLLTLLAMEFIEQVSAFGHIEGVADALGGNALVGLAIVCCVAFLVTLLGLRCACGLIATAVSAVRVLATWVAAGTASVNDRCATVRRARERRGGHSNARRSRCRGLRAPPAALV